MQSLPGSNLPDQWYRLLRDSQTAISPSHRFQDVRLRWTQGCSDSPMSDLPECAIICSTMALERSGAILDKSTVSPCDHILERCEVQKSIDCTTLHKALLFQIHSRPCNLTGVWVNPHFSGPAKVIHRFSAVLVMDGFSRGLLPCATARREKTVPAKDFRHRACND